MFRLTSVGQFLHVVRGASQGAKQSMICYQQGTLPTVSKTNNEFHPVLANGLFGAGQ